MMLNDTIKQLNDQLDQIRTAAQEEFKESFARTNHFDHVTRNLGSIIISSKELAESKDYFEWPLSETLKTKYKEEANQLREVLTTYLGLIEEFKDYRQGEFVDVIGFFPDLVKKQCEDYVWISEKRLREKARSEGDIFSKKYDEEVLEPLRQKMDKALQEFGFPNNSNFYDVCSNLLCLIYLTGTNPPKPGNKELNAETKDAFDLYIRMVEESPAFRNREAQALYLVQGFDSYNDYVTECARRLSEGTLGEGLLR